MYDLYTMIGLVVASMVVCSIWTLVIPLYDSITKPEAFKKRNKTQRDAAYLEFKKEKEDESKRIKKASRKVSRRIF